jgi:ribonucleotide reductase beta subunit family protein with ferritin-like domain
MAGLGAGDAGGSAAVSVDARRYTVFPVRHPRLWQMYKKQIANFWTVEEVDLQQDSRDWEKLTAPERFFLAHVLAFFAGSDGIVNENLDLHFSREVLIPEARAFYAFQQGVEAIHSEMYGLLLDTLVKDEAEKHRLFNGIEEIPAVRMKAEWALKWSASGTSSFRERLVAFACVEGIHFSGSFCAIHWLKTKKVMPGLCFSNELISRDEGLHTEFAVLLYHTLPGPPLPERTVQAIVREALEIEKVFVTESLPVRMINMNSELMIRYLEFVADRLLLQLGCAAAFGARNPFEFMNQISMDNKTNFFENRSAEYRRAGVGFRETAINIDPEGTDF